MSCHKFDRGNDQSPRSNVRDDSDVEFPGTSHADVFAAAEIADASARSGDSPFNGSFFNDVLQAWNSHFQADFSKADRLFEDLLTPRFFTPAGLEWGKSLRFRGDHARALTLLDAALENAKRQEDLASQLNACCQMMLSFRQIADETGRRQSLQQAIRLALNSPDFTGFPAILQLEIDRDHGRLPNQYHFQQSFQQTSDDRFLTESLSEVNAMRLQMQGERAHQTGQSQAAQQFHEAAYQNFMTLGHYVGALQSAECLCLSLLTQGDWKKGITTFSKIRSLAECLGDSTKLADAIRYESKLQRAMRTKGDALLRN